MPERADSLLRFLAPVALVACALAVAYVVASSQGTRESAPTAAAQAGAPAARTYRVRSGDTLAEIARRTGVGIERLRALNPRLDPQAIVAGQRVKLRR